jgi:DNA-directed RNA polymerase specialized sigma subunit
VDFGRYVSGYTPHAIILSDHDKKVLLKKKKEARSQICAKLAWVGWPALRYFEKQFGACAKKMNERKEFCRSWMEGMENLSSRAGRGFLAPDLVHRLAEEISGLSSVDVLGIADCFFAGNESAWGGATQDGEESRTHHLYVAQRIEVWESCVSEVLRASIGQAHRAALQGVERNGRLPSTDGADFLQEALIAAVRSIDRFDADVPASKVSSYIGLNMSSAILRYHQNERTVVRVPINVQEEYHRQKKPLLGEVSTELHDKNAEIPLDAEEPQMGAGTLADCLPDKTEVKTDEVAQIVASVLKKLKPVDQEIIALRYDLPDAKKIALNAIDSEFSASIAQSAAILKRACKRKTRRGLRIKVLKALR